MNQVWILCRRFELDLNRIALQARGNREHAWALYKRLQNEDNSFVEKVAKAVGYATEGPGNWRSNFWREGVSTRLSPDEKAEVLRLRSRRVSIAKGLVSGAESHLATLCDAFEDKLSDGERELRASRIDTSPERVWARYNRFADITNAFLDNFAKAIDYGIRKERFWRHALWNSGVPQQFSAELRTRVPELGAHASRVKAGLEARAKELIPAHVDSLYSICQRGLRDIPQKVAAIQEPSLASLLELREIENEVDSTIDAFLEALAKALKYTTSGPKSEWQAHVLNVGVANHIPGRRGRILGLKADAASIRGDLDERFSELLRLHVNTLCDTCQRKLDDIPPKIADTQQPSLASLLELRQLEKEVDATIDTLFEDLATALQYTTDGFKSNWQRSVLYTGVPNHVPDQQERILELKTDASSIKSDLNERARKLLQPLVNSLSDNCRRGLTDIRQALAGIHQPTLVSLEQLRRLKNEVDTTIDTFLESLAKALNRPTAGPRLLDEALPDHIPDQQEKILQLKADAASIQGELDECFNELLRLHVNTLCDTCQRKLDGIPQNLTNIRLPSLTSLQQVRALKEEASATIDVFLEELANALRYKSEGGKSAWQRHVLEAAVPNHVPDRKERILSLRANADSIRDELDERFKELLGPHVDTLYNGCRRRLSDIQQAFAAIEQPSLASLRQLRQLDNELDATIDAFLENLAKALNRATTGRNKFVWQSHLLEDVPSLIPHQQGSVLELKTDASSIKNQLHASLEELLRLYVDGLCDICQRGLDKLRQKLTADRHGPLVSPQQLQQLGGEVDKIIDTFLEDLANALNRTTIGTKRVWQKNLLRDAVRRSLPDQQAKIIQLKADASSIKDDISNQTRILSAKEPSGLPNRTSRTKNKGQPDIKYYRRDRLGANPFQCRTIDGGQGTGAMPRHR